MLKIGFCPVFVVTFDLQQTFNLQPIFNLQSAIGS
jgi:hypothetical protein